MGVKAETRDIDFSGEPGTQLNTQLEVYKELDSIDNIGDMTYHEKHAFNLEHLAGITNLIHVKLPSYMPLLDMNSHFGSMPIKKSENNEEQHYKSNLGVTERKGFFFASSDSFGNCRVWEVDRKSALMDFKYKEEEFNAFDAAAPPPVRCMV